MIERALRPIGGKLRLLPELMNPSPHMTVGEWWPPAGSTRASICRGAVERHEHISKVGTVRLRRTLYMPVLVAIRWGPRMQAFYYKLSAPGKRPIVAVVAVVRGLLQSIFAMSKHGQPSDGDTFY